jgi:hypothetical protein
MTGRLLVREGTRAPSGHVLLLVGGYDGSGNYGDMVQLQAVLELLAALGPAVTPVPVIELAYARGHEALAAASPQLGAVPVAHYDSGEAGPPPGFERLALAPDAASGGLYLYGGGYLNASWGARKLDMARTAEEVVRAAGIPLAAPVSSGLQVEARWAEALDGPPRELLERLAPFGVRDERSLPAFAADALLTGDDAVGVLAAHAGTAAPDAGLRVNVHLQDETWVTAEPDALLGFVSELLRALEAAAGERVTVQPVIAYEDGRITERPLAERLGAAAEPLVLRPGDLGDSLAQVGRAALTISCSYHVALTSDLVGVPAALLAGNPYYEQKAAGLRALFALPAVDPRGEAGAAAAALLGHARGGSALRLGALRAVARRRDAELALLARLAPSLAAHRAAAPAGRTSELLERLAVLRADHADALADLDRLRARAAEELADRDALIAERAAEFNALWDELQGYVAERERLLARCAELEEGLREHQAAAERLQRQEAVVLGSRSWRMTEPLRRGARVLRGNGRGG